MRFLIFILAMSLATVRSWHLNSKSIRKAFVATAAGVSISAGLPFPAIADSSMAIAKQDSASSSSIAEIGVDMLGKNEPIGKYLGKKATLIVNVASQCALTPQYEGLVGLYDKYNKDGLEILAFSSNQFGGQEPKEVEEVRKDMLAQYNVKFPIFDKVDVNGGSSAVIYKIIKENKEIRQNNEKDLKKISWNFEKFLIDADGVPVRRYRPGTLPEDLNKDITSLISTGKVPPRVKATLNAF